VEICRIPEVEIYRKWICIICVIEMSVSMLDSMPEVVQSFTAEFRRVPYTCNLDF